MKTLLALCGSLLISACQAGVYNITAGRSTAQREAITFEFDVQGELGVVTGIEVRLSIGHPASSDLRVGLSPRRVVNIAGSGSNFQDTLISSRSNGPVIGSSGTESPFAGPEWGGIVYRPFEDLNQFIGQNPNRLYWLMIADVGSDDTGFVYKNGDAAPWGTAIGTQLIIHTSVPEPSTWAALGLGSFWLARSRRIARSAPR